MNWPLFWAYLVVGTFIFVLFAITPSWAHDWYDAMCCHDRDCHPINSCDEITELPNGDLEWNGYKFAKDRIKPSHDSKCHVCIYKGFSTFSTNGSYETPLCIYIQQGS